MQLNESAVSKCLYSPLSDDLSAEMSGKLPMISSYEGEIPINSVLRYLVLMYDIQSPMHKETKDFYQRKRECAKVADFPKENDRWRADAAAILIGTDEWFNSLVVKYLALLALPEYTQLIAYLELLARRMNRILNGDDDDKTHLVVNALTETIKKLTNAIFGSGTTDEIQQARQALYEQAEEDRARMRPEDVINMLNEGGLPSSWSPYGDYEVEKITFIGDKKPITDVD